MPRGTMHAPKEPSQRRRTNAPAHGEIVATRDGEIRGLELVELTGRPTWSAETLGWYDRWRKMPQAIHFEETDWGRLAMLAPIVEAYYRRPSAAALGEIRMSEERLGATLVDRQRARIRIDDAQGEDAQILSLVPDARADLRRRMAQ